MALAQSGGAIIGTILNADSGEGVPFANVIVLVDGVEANGAQTECTALGGLRTV